MLNRTEVGEELLMAGRHDSGHTLSKGALRALASGEVIVGLELEYEIPERHRVLRALGERLSRRERKKLSVERDPTLSRLNGAEFILSAEPARKLLSPRGAWGTLLREVGAALVGGRRFSEEPQGLHINVSATNAPAAESCSVAAGVLCLLSVDHPLLARLAGRYETVQVYLSQGERNYRYREVALVRVGGTVQNAIWRNEFRQFGSSVDPALMKVQVLYALLVRGFSTTEAWGQHLGGLLHGQPLFPHAVPYRPLVARKLGELPTEAPVGQLCKAAARSFYEYVRDYQPVRGEKGTYRLLLQYLMGRRLAPEHTPMFSQIKELARSVLSPRKKENTCEHLIAA